MKLEQAARQALKALGGDDSDFNIKHYEAITALREALAEQAEQEPVAFISNIATYADGSPVIYHKSFSSENVNFNKMKPLYAAPVRTKDLTDDEIEAIVDSVGAYEVGYWHHAFARAVIAADREKNK